MTITSSAVVEDAIQTDGRRWLTERFTDQYGIAHDVRLLVAAAFDASADLTSRGPDIDAGLTAAEIAANIAAVSSLGSLATPTFKYSTGTQNATALRAAYAGMTQLQAIMTGDYLNTLTDAQLENAFGLTAMQVTNLRNNKLIPAANTAAAVRAATGQ